MVVHLYVDCTRKDVNKKVKIGTNSLLLKIMTSNGRKFNKAKVAHKLYQE